MDVPQSESEALTLLATEGYTTDFGLAGAGVACPVCGRVHPAERLVVEHTFRFEGDTDPGDESIVLGLRCPDCGALGVVVSAYGPDADPDLLAVLARLAP
ncbi:MAG: hypothetical protein JWL70_428 [Acidimicrobiia bacterium]|nr:hypothetical protein [Acidimicrobiia bacterium]